MALFTSWLERRGQAERSRASLHRRLLDQAHVRADLIVTTTVAMRSGTWSISAFSTATRFYAAADQVWLKDDEACIIHGLIWREVCGRPRVLSAKAAAELLDRPGLSLPADVAGEYAVLRLHRCGTLTCFSDRAGLHQIFHARADGAPAISSRASLLATLIGDWTVNDRAGAWLGTTGYRIGDSTSLRSVTQVPQGHMLVADADGAVLRSLPDPVVAFTSDERGFLAANGAALFESGLVQAKAAALLAAGDDDAVQVPITGGKDSRAVLATCLAAGLRSRLRLFTRGYEGHPDVIAGRGVADALGLPHRREAPLGSDGPAHWTVTQFFDNLSAQAFQTDGNMGGWDYLVGISVGQDTLLTGHMGEVLKAYSKRAIPQGELDPVAMVRLQAPFDPLGLLRPAARDHLIAELMDQMVRATGEGAATGDLPDIFYFRNRIPNWLGGIRGIKSFERQPVMPLGVPSLMALAFRLSPEERRQELLHYRLVAAAAPELLAPAFALQCWSPGLGAPNTPPIPAGAGSPPVFGNWQYSLNHNPGIRAALADFFASRDLSLWQQIDRDTLLDRLRHNTFSYFDGISLLGLTIAAFHSAGFVRPIRLGEAGGRMPIFVSDFRNPDQRPRNDELPHAQRETTRPIDPMMEQRLNGAPYPSTPVHLDGHLDAIRGGIANVGGVDDPSRVEITESAIHLDGWMRAPDWPGARVAIEVRVADRVIAGAVADKPRADLKDAFGGDGGHGFSMTIDAAEIRALDVGQQGTEIVLAGFDSDVVPIGGRIQITS